MEMTFYVDMSGCDYILSYYIMMAELGLMVDPSHVRLSYILRHTGGLSQLRMP